MTSTTSSKLRQGKTFFLWSLFTGKTAMIIYLSLLTFLCLSVAVFAMGMTLQLHETDTSDIWQTAAYFTIFFTTAVSFVFTFVFSIKEFSYLHDKRKTDMFGALPASRRTIFFSKLAAVIAQSAAPVILIMTFLAIMNRGTLPDYLGMSGFFGSPEAETAVRSIWHEMLQILVGLIANAVFLAFLSVCCGRTADKILTYIFINIAYPIAALLVQTLPGSFLIGYTADINDFFTCALSPYTAIWSVNPAYWAGFALLLGSLSYILLPRRKAECAQSHFAFKAPLIITKVLVSFAAGMVSAYLFGIIFSAVNADKFAFIIGWVMGSFITYFVIQIIFAKGFKRFGMGMIPYGALAAGFAVLMLVINTGLFGYENYVPKVDEVESVSLAGDYQAIIKGKNVINATITDKKEIEDCVKGHKEVIAFRKSQNPSISELTFRTPNYDAMAYAYSDEDSVVRFEYKLKDGRTVSRYYGEFWGEELRFPSSKTYLKNTNKLFLIDPGYADEIYFDSDYDDEYIAEIEIDGRIYAIDGSTFRTKKNRVELIEALKSDILTCGKVSDEDDYLCCVNITYGEDNTLFDIYTEVYVNSKYKNTIELLKRNAVKVRAVKDSEAGA